VLDQIAAAIAAKNCIAFSYDGLNRFVEPHACGLTARGKPVFRGFQPAGETSREHGWKLFSIEKIEDLQVLGLTFAEPRPGYALNDKQIPHLKAQIDA
jgi:hypothetical protein